MEKNAIAGYNSCGAWMNGEYFIIDRTFLTGEGNSAPRTAIIRKVKIRQIECQNNWVLMAYAFSLV